MPTKPEEGTTIPATAEEVIEDSAYDADSYPTFEFITGVAGSGKSYLIKQRASTYRGYELLATTGIAAINVGGSTINSVLRYFDTEALRHSYTQGWLVTLLRKLWQAGTRRLVLDEVSMLDGNQLTVLVRAIEEVNDWINREGWYDLKNSYLGEELLDIAEELKLTLTGDFCQLPPVKAPFAFASPEWGKFKDSTTRLTEVKRQVDKDFCEALGYIRRGDGVKACEFFRDSFHRSTQDDFPGPTLLAKNDEVDRYNRLRHDTCSGDSFYFSAIRAGKERPEWKQIPDKLELKVGAQVMILANKSDLGNLLYCNGDLGTFLGPTNTYTKAGAEIQAAKVKLYRTGQEVTVVPASRDNREPRDEKASDKRDPLGTVREGLWKVVGTITYIPLRLAYATTTHKSQGLSLDKVQVNIASHFFSSPAMLYVALSRGRSMDGLRLVGTPDAFVRRCVVDSRCKEWV